MIMNIKNDNIFLFINNKELNLEEFCNIFSKIISNQMELKNKWKTITLVMNSVVINLEDIDLMKWYSKEVFQLTNVYLVLTNPTNIPENSNFYGIFRKVFIKGIDYVDLLANELYSKIENLIYIGSENSDINKIIKNDIKKNNIPIFKSAFEVKVVKAKDKEKEDKKDDKK